MSCGPPDRAEAPCGRGYVERVSYVGGELAVEGWLFAPGNALDEVRLEVDGSVVGKALPLPRPDVAGEFRAFPEAVRSGIALRVRLSPWPPGLWRNLQIVGTTGGAVVARIRLRFRPDFRGGLPDPPPHLRFRVTRSHSLAVFCYGGLQTFGELWETIARHRDPTTVRRLLDWGCGSGRVTAYFLKYWQHARVWGCDIDGEAVAWCRANFAEGRFEVVGTLPPTGFRGDHFDLIVACSVLTHLRQELQLDWLREMRRLLVPGGLLLASVHGEHATSMAASLRAREEVEARGISDSSIDSTLDGLTPASYYRATFQSRDYTVSEFSRIFEVLDYVPQGVTNFQDLLVLRRPAAAVLDEPVSGAGAANDDRATIADGC